MPPARNWLPAIDAYASPLACNWLPARAYAPPLHAIGSSKPKHTLPPCLRLAPSPSICLISPPVIGWAPPPAGGAPPAPASTTPSPRGAASATPPARAACADSPPRAAWRSPRDGLRTACAAPTPCTPSGCTSPPAQVTPSGRSERSRSEDGGPALRGGRYLGYPALGGWGHRESVQGEGHRAYALWCVGRVSLGMPAQ
eukprot:1178880-Prorocentrum_minimum.AAC.8